MPRKANTPRLLMIFAVLALLIGAIAYLNASQQAQLPVGHSEGDGHNHG